ncbi:hypothetical protein, partial [Pseudomonas sp. P5_A2_2]
STLIHGDDVDIIQCAFALPPEIWPYDPKFSGCSLHQTVKHSPVEKAGVKTKNDWKMGLTCIFDPKCRAIDLNIFTLRIGARQHVDSPQRQAFQMSEQGSARTTAHLFFIK